MDLLHFAKQLRREQTPAEQLLWTQLRAHRFHGLKFKRQKPIGQYIVDFVCLEKRLVIELDGEHHREQSEQDAVRTGWLSAQGFTVLRFWNQAVLQDIEAVLARIAFVALSPGPSPAKRERGLNGGVT